MFAHRVSFVAMACSIAGLLVACAPITPESSSGELADQIDELAEFVRAVHPRPSSMTDERIAAARDRVAARDLGPELAYARAARFLLSSLADAHVRVPVPEAVAHSSELLPVVLREVQGRLHVLAGPPELEVGSELLAIEGRAIAEIVERLADTMMVDGDRPELRRTLATREFVSAYHLEFGFSAAYALQLRTPQGVESRIEVAGVGLERLQSISMGHGIGFAEPWPRLDRSPQGDAIVRLPSFGTREREAYVAEVDRVFAALDPDEPVVLDLRGNAGGDRSLGMAVLAHLLPRPCRQWARVSSRIRKIPRKFRDRVHYPIAPATILEDFPGQRVDERYVFEGDPLSDSCRPSASPHRGPLRVVFDHLTNSAAVEFLVGLWDQRPEVESFASHETLGACAGHIGQMPVEYRAEPGRPGLWISLFDIEHVPTRHCQVGRGFAPDRWIVPTLDDWLHDADPVMEAAIAWDAMARGGG